MHIHSVSAQQASICNYSMRPCLGLRAAIAHLFQPQAYCQAHHIIVRNLKAVIELDQQKKTRRKLHKPLTQKVLRQEASERWLFSLSSGDSDTTAGVRAEEFATGLELCASADDLLQSEEVANGSDTANAWVLGIDPDNGGAVAVLKPGDSAAQVYDAPTVQVCSGKRTCRRLDTRSIISLLRGLEVPKGSSAYIEQAIPFPRDGKQGWWSNGFSYGLWIGILVSLGFSVIPIPSMVWKKHFDLAGKTNCKGFKFSFLFEIWHLQRTLLRSLEGEIRQVVCNYCGKKIKGINCFKCHLALICGRDVSLCDAVQLDVI